MSNTIWLVGTAADVGWEDVGSGKLSFFVETTEPGVELGATRSEFNQVLLWGKLAVRMFQELRNGARVWVLAQRKSRTYRDNLITETIGQRVHVVAPEAPSCNRVWMQGNTGREAAIEITQGGQARFPFALCVTENIRDAHGQWENRGHWTFVTAWGKVAEAMPKTLAKGSPVMVTGALQTRRNVSGTPITSVVARQVFVAPELLRSSAPRPPDPHFEEESSTPF